MTKKTDKTISLRVMQRTLPGGLFERNKTETFLDSRSIMQALHVIKDAAVEEHTKGNIQLLLDQIYESHLTY